MIKLPDLEIDPFRFFNEEFKLPEDITSLTPEQLRACHSYWGEQYVYSQSRVSFFETRLTNINRKRRLRSNQLFVKLKETRRLANDLVRAKVEIDKKIIKLDDRIEKIESLLTIWRVLMETCRTYMQICSRDQSYREKEVDYYYKRGGKGK